jgi:hypothetical protein
VIRTRETDWRSVGWFSLWIGHELNHGST